MSIFSSSIQEWFLHNHRDLPWRNTKDPYKIWLSEIILQQTRVKQGYDYYLKFIEDYPTVDRLAAADEQEVLRLWQGLGYYSRARNLRIAAQQIMNEFHGEFPNNYKDIISLRGVGEYTAAAIASFAFDFPYPVLDGNAFRVLSRYFNDNSPIDTGKGKNIFKAYVQTVFDKDNPALFNQSIMEVGALICKPTNPDCLHCPLSHSCEALQNNTYQSLPAKSRKVKVTDRYLNYLVFPSENIWLEKIKDMGIWKNMYQFPMVETEKEMTMPQINSIVNREFEIEVKSKYLEVKHKLTHQNIYATFWILDHPINNQEYTPLNLIEIEKYPLPRLVERFIENHTNLFQ